MNTSQDIVCWLYEELALPDTVIAKLVDASPSAIWHIRHGDQTGRNLWPRLCNVMRLITANRLGYALEYEEKYWRGGRG